MDEAIRIGDDITITVIGIQGGRVRLGIEAPHDVPINRQEVWDAIQRQKGDTSCGENDSQ